MARVSVFTIPPGLPFLDTLVDALLGGRLIEGFRPDPAADAFALADVTLLLPTRRAARAVRESFLARSPGALLLPRIRTLGDLDEDEADDGPAETLAPAVPAAERLLALTRLVLGWSGALVRAAADLPDEPLVVPASPADAARLAAALAALIDQVGVEPQAWLGLAEDHGDLTRYWEITRSFLAIATAAWPQHLAERALLDPGARRDLAIRAEAERLHTSGSAAPVIAAGSTGSVPATAELLAAIASLPNGAVVLPGLDQQLDAASWEEIGSDPDDPAAFGHPQFGLKRLIERFGIPRGDVIALGAANDALGLRGRALSEAMRPAGTTERWTAVPVLSEGEKAAALAGVAIVEAANERGEALAIATLFRRTVDEGRVAALVTPDRGLARRVSVELRRWGIDADDSAGRPLALTPPGTLALLVAETALGGAAAETLLALARHPLAAFSLKPGAARYAARALERAVLRGPRLAPGLAALRHALTERHAERGLPRGERLMRTNAADDLRADHWEGAIALAARMQAALEPLEALTGESAIPFAALAAAHRAALDGVAAAEDGGSALYAGEDGEALALALDAIAEGAVAGPDISPADYPGLFAALIERSMVRRRGGLDPRVHIWGALEARLQRVDVMVLGGFNEGTWPAQTRLDPLASRPMRVALALDPPERRIGLAAHDAAQALAQPEVWVTRAERENGEPRVASRWLQRLTAYAGPALADAMRARGADVLRLARHLDRPQRDDPPVRPRPSPPLALRPQKLSVTRIETLIRDPYAIYAESILKLRPFEALGTLPDVRERGTLIHDILEDFVRAHPTGPFDAVALDDLLSRGRAAFAHFADFPEMIALWWPRFERIARWFIATEAERGDVAARHVENLGELAIGGFTLSARADRLDLMQDGTLAIIDYKTGAPPSLKEVRSLSPQLPLEALIARAGGFPGLPQTAASRLIYYRLTGRGEGGEQADRTESKDATLADTLASTRARLADLVAYFAHEDAAYLSNKVPKPRRTYVGDYDHLARISEWVATDEEEDGNE